MDMNRENTMDEMKNKSKEVGSKVTEQMRKLADQATDKLHAAQDQIQESSKDWMNYVKDHPFQMVALTGIACFIAGRMANKD